MSTRLRVAGAIVAGATIVVVAVVVALRPGTSSDRPPTDRRAIGRAESNRPGSATWQPSAKPGREADTLFLPDLGSVATINAGGGFVNGDETKPQRELAAGFQFGPGRFGPAVRPIPGRADFVFYPSDGLVDGREFTVEFWARSPKPWSAIDTGKATVALTGGYGGNRLQILAAYKGVCSVSAGSLATVAAKAFARAWQAPCDKLGLTAEKWHHVAVTLKASTLRIYVNGRPVGQIDGVRLLPLWSDTTKSEGVQIGGEPGASNGAWISDLRISRTARVPGRRVRLRSLAGSLTIDARRTAGVVPPRFIASLKITPISPAQARAGLDGIREADTLTATPIKRGPPDATHPTPGDSGQFSYDWQIVDRSFDWLKVRGLDGYIGADSTPQILGGSVPPKGDTPFFGGTWAREVPNDLGAWATIVGDLVRHVRRRGYRVPRWSVWNEPDLSTAFWKGTMKQYLDLYVATARAIKAADPQARVGGPELASLDAPWIEALFKRARADHAPLDFIAIHDYSGDLNTLTQARVIVDQYARRAGYATPFPIAVGEFNWSDRNEHGSGVAAFTNEFLHVRSFNAAYTTAALSQAVHLGGFESFVWSHTGGFHGPIRSGVKYATMQLIGDHGEQWAPFNALVGWKRTVGPRVLSTREDLPPGVSALASGDPASARVGVVLTNYGFVQRQARRVTLRLKNLGRDSYRLRRYLVDRQHSSRWDAAEDRPEGAAHDGLETVDDRMIDVSGITALSIDLPPWSSTFVTLDRA
jgi:hypothetical protein